MPNGNYEKGYGTLEEIDTFPRILEWTIPDVFQLSKQTDDWVTSELFRYYIHICGFVVKPCVSKCLPGMIKFALKGIGKAGLTRWKLELCKTDGTVLRKCGGWKENGCEVQMDIYISIKEVQKGCTDDGILKLRCTLHCEDTLKYPDPDEEEKYTDTSSQTEPTSGTEKLSSDLEEFLNRGDNSNVTIRVEGEVFKVHKSILGARTPVFTSMFKHGMSENITNIVNIDDCDAMAFREFLHYLYTGRVTKFFPNCIFNLYKIADKYQVDQLKAYCLEFIKNKLTVDTFCDAVILSLQYVEEELMDMITKFFIKKKTKIVNTEQWQIFASENSVESNRLLLEVLELKKQPALFTEILPTSDFNQNPDMIAGFIEELYLCPKIVEWTIPHFFELPDQSGFTIASPIFKFQQYSCRFSVKPHGTKKKPSIVMFNLIGIGKIGTLRWELEVRRADDTVMKKCSGLKNDGSEVEMNMFIPVDDVHAGWYCSGIRYLRLKGTLYSEETLHYPEKEESYAFTGSQTEEIARTDKLSYDLEELLIRGDDSDVTIRVEGKEFKAHVSILEARAPMFTSMLKHKMSESESNTNAVNIDDCDAITFQEFLSYIYSGRVAELSFNTIFSLHELANKYQLDELKACKVRQIAWSP